MTKICTKCGIAGPLSEFSKSVGYADGRSGWCKPCHVAYSSEWARHNKDKRLDSSRRWDANNLESRRAARRKWQAKFYASRTPIQKLNDAIRTKLYRQLKETKDGRRTVVLLGYPLADLKAHLEARFAPGMSWDNYGKWHIDHIRPKASFSITDAADPDFKECWALSNLQPLWAEDNCRKQAKWTAN